ncbi:Cro/C1-type HTH DNA-binding domain-containing protein [Sulfitobacter brevis]|uniref:Cro/C1-type HTH DNA-binding domain-containing protein n=2 Tax=Sulfitobacter brevis TaxID=74348 RepID=A0A1I1V5M0_9RHOB|nr:Cro/C1-type HTH DNA-binding domain-containing protein [Sulfitobacter brevis]
MTDDHIVSIKGETMGQSRSPAELRNMLGANLRRLATDYESVSLLSRDLGINRTQFNRYLSSESFPRPDVLARICAFFNVDARILLEPIESLTGKQDPINNPYLRNFVGSGVVGVSENKFPSGFYRFSRRSFVDVDVFTVGIVYVFRRDASTYLRGYETVGAMKIQNLPTDTASREFRGLFIQQDDGVSVIASRNNAMTCSFNYLSPVASFQNNFWVGYATRTIPDDPEGQRATRLVYEYLGNAAKALAVARTCGFCDAAELPAFHRRLLKPDQPFA